MWKRFSDGARGAATFASTFLSFAFRSSVPPEKEPSDSFLRQRFTQRAREAIFYAQEEAEKIGANRVSTEHLLLGILREEANVATRILVSLGISLEVIRRDLQRFSEPDKMQAMPGMPLTPRSKRVFDLAYDEARLLGNGYVGSEHILLGLVREGEGLAARVLAKQGIELNTTRREVMRFQERQKSNSSKPEPE